MSFSGNSSNCASESDDCSESSTDSNAESLTPMPKQAVPLAPPQGFGTLVSVNGGLLVVQDNITSIAHSDRFRGILRYDVSANQWTEWIQYPKEMNIRVAGTVWNEKRQILYIFQNNEFRHDGKDGVIINAYWQTSQVIIVNLIEKTFRTESNERFDEEQFRNLIPVMAGDVIYIYYNGEGDKCLKWNVETNQVERVLNADFNLLGGAVRAVYCDMQ